MTERLSLAIYIPDMGGGGMERMRLNLLPFFLDQGLDVTLVLNRARGVLLKHVPAPVDVVSLDRRTSLGLPRLVHFLRRRRPDIVLSSLGHNNVAALWARALVRVPSRVIVCQHNALSAEVASHGSWQFRALPGLYRMFLPAADGIIAVSAGVADDMVRLTGIDRARVTVIHNPAMPDRFQEKAALPVAHPFFDSGLPTLVAVGRLVPQKDYPTLLRAFHLLARDRRVRLLVLGEGPQRGELEALRAELGLDGQVDLIGYQENPLPYMSRASALVLASRFEGFGNILVEALACGTPVVSTDCPYGPSEILDGGRFGRLCPVGNPPALAAAMAAMLDRPPPPDQLRRRSRQFSVEVIGGRYLSLFRDVMSAPPLPRAARQGVPAS